MKTDTIKGGARDMTYKTQNLLTGKCDYFDTFEAATKFCESSRDCMIVVYRQFFSCSQVVYRNFKR